MLAGLKAFKDEANSQTQPLNAGTAKLHERVSTGFRQSGLHEEDGTAFCNAHVAVKALETES